jgi:hypothetical protein
MPSRYTTKTNPSVSDMTAKVRRAIITSLIRCSSMIRSYTVAFTVLTPARMRF